METNKKESNEKTLLLPAEEKPISSTKKPKGKKIAHCSACSIIVFFVIFVTLVVIATVSIFSILYVSDAKFVRKVVHILGQLFFGASNSDFKISKIEYNPPTLNMKIRITVTIEPCDTGRYTYDYYYVNGETIVLLEKGAECKNHEMSISLPKDGDVYFQVSVKVQFSDPVLVKKKIEFYRCPEYPASPKLVCIYGDTTTNGCCVDTCCSRNLCKKCDDDEYICCDSTTEECQKKDNNELFCCASGYVGCGDVCCNSELCKECSDGSHICCDQKDDTCQQKDDTEFVCCDSGLIACGNECCEHCCNGECCENDCCGNECCIDDNVCCESECWESSKCCKGKKCDGECCNDECCQDDYICCKENEKDTCVKEGVCCGGNVCGDDYECCLNECVPKGHCCNNSGEIEICDTLCCGEGEGQMLCCSGGYSCCLNQCWPEGQCCEKNTTLCNTKCCQYETGGDLCCEGDGKPNICCGNGECCYKTCENNACPISIGECSCSGDPHCMTWSGYRHEFQEGREFECVSSNNGLNVWINYYVPTATATFSLNGNISFTHKGLGTSFIDVMPGTKATILIDGVAFDWNNWNVKGITLTYTSESNLVFTFTNGETIKIQTYGSYNGFMNWQISGLDWKFYANNVKGICGVFPPNKTTGSDIRNKFTGEYADITDRTFKSSTQTLHTYRVDMNGLSSPHEFVPGPTSEDLWNSQNDYKSYEMGKDICSKYEEYYSMENCMYDFFYLKDDIDTFIQMMEDLKNL